MSQVYKRVRRVEFRDTDAAGIVHFSVFFAYMEETEHEFLRHLGLGVVAQVDGQTISWPRVSAQCDYLAPLKFEQQVEIQLAVARIGSKSVSYQFDFVVDTVTVAQGSITAVCCLWHHDGTPPASIAIPPSFIDKIQPFQKP